MRGIHGVLLAVGLLFLQTTIAGAIEFSSTNFKIDGVVGESYSGVSSSSSYSLTAVAGESVVGNGSAGSYRLGEGYIPRLQNELMLSLQPSGLAAYYRAEAGQGKVLYDNSANSNNAVFTVAPTWSAGKIGSGITLNGSTMYGIANHHASINLGTVTVSAWVKTTATPGSSQSIIEKRSSGSGAFPYAIRYTSSNTIECDSGDGSSTATMDSGDTIDDGRWHHVVCVMNPSSTKTLYLDGEEKDQSSTSLGTTTNTSDLGIGARADGAQFFDGSLDEVKLYATSLNAEQVRAEYEAQLRGKLEGLTLGTITPGTSETVDTDTIVQTDAPGYTLSVSQNHDLTNGGTGANADFAQDFNSFGNGTTLTTANTGFDNFSVSGTGTFTSSTTSPQLHSTYGRVETTSTSTFAMRKDFSSTSERYFRFYARMSSIPASTQTIFAVRNGGATASALRVQPDGTILLRDGFLTVATSSVAMTPNQWMRFELRYNSDTQTQTLRMYDDATSSADATIPDEVLSGAATNGPIDDMQIGLVTTQDNQTHDLDDIATSTEGWMGPAGSETIPAVSSGTIGTPVAWSEGSTSGLGFSLTVAPSLDGKWGTGANYAAFPNSATSFFTRAGYLNGAKDTVTLRSRLDVATSQSPGGYSNTVTITGTMNP